MDGMDRATALAEVAAVLGAAGVTLSKPFPRQKSRGPGKLRLIVADVDAAPDHILENLRSKFREETALDSQSENKPGP